MKVVVFDADVLGRQRTGDETYALNLLRELGGIVSAAGIRLVAVTRRTDLVPDGIEPFELSTRSQEVRMAWTFSRALRTLGASLCHTQHALPVRPPCPCVVTVHDVSFAREPDVMGWKDRAVFRRVVPHAVKRAVRVLTVSERTKRDLIELYDVPPERIVVTPNGVDPAFSPGPGAHDYVLSVGAIQPRKNQLAALDAALALGLPLVVVGPEKDAALAAELRQRGAGTLGPHAPGGAEARGELAHQPRLPGPGLTGDDHALCLRRRGVGRRRQRAQLVLALEQYRTAH